MADHNKFASNPISIWEDLKRRNVYRVGVGYVALAWFVIEVSETVFPRVGFADWTVTLVIVISLVGLPIALVLGWTLEITPKGVVFDKPRGVGWPTHILIDSLIIVALIAAGSIYWFRIHEIGEPGAGVVKNSIAVLPFVSVGQDLDTDALAFGLADELLTSLAQLGELTVSSRIASEFFKDRVLPLRTIASELGVRYIVEGSVQKESNRVRVTVQLIDADKNDHVWAENYEESMGGLLSLRSRIVADMVGGLGIALSIDSVKALQSEPTDNGDAFVYYLHAKEYLRRSRNATNLSAAEDLFSKAIESDPRFAAAHAGLCQTYLGSFVMERDAEWFERSEKSCHRAMTLDDKQVDVYVALGDLYRASSQNEKAIEYYDAGLDLNPYSAEATMKKGLALDRSGQIADAETDLRHAVTLEPFYWRAQNSLGLFLMRHSRYDDSVVIFEGVTALTPERNTAFNNLAAALYMAGDEDASIAAFERSIEIAPNRSALMNTANMHYYRGEFDNAAIRYAQAVEMMPKDDRPLGGLAASLRFVSGREAEATVLFKEAANLAEELLSISADDYLARARLANYRAYAGDPEGALAALDQANVDEATDLEVLFFSCLTYMALDRQQDAIELLEALVNNGYTRDILEKDPDLAPIRSDARIIAAFAASE